MLGRGVFETADLWSGVDEWFYAHSKGLVKPGGPHKQKQN